MEVTLTPEQQDFVRLAVADGRIGSEEEAVRQALALWEKHERARLDFILTLDQARASLARGEGRTLVSEDDFRQLAASIKERGRAALTR
ncbi:MAG TPA: type II toxin-antitoxin system ParD family antitoxin [Acidobacteriaceae bacterium]|nr:type II toxin-antitoxin system ParD family antitoxin [Acidobacteriaceae bacterium]